MIPKKRGAKGKLNKRVQEKVAECVERGLSVDDSARLAGVHKNSIYKWLARGEEEDSGIYRRFFIRIRDAQAGFKRTHLDRIVKASLEPTVKTRYNETYDGVDSRGKKINLRVTTTRETVPPDVAHSKWLLSHKFPQEFGRQVVEHDGTIENPSGVAVGVVVNMIFDDGEGQKQLPVGPTDGIEEPEELAEVPIAGELEAAESDKSAVSPDLDLNSMDLDS